jgi:predicted nucleic acid-binding Zn ribbon protein
MRRKGPVLLGAVLDEFLKNIGVERKVKEGMVLERWSEVVGPYIAKVSKADRIENGVLYVKVINPSWKHHLFMFRREIIKKLNDSLKLDVVREIVFIDSGADFLKT